MNVFTAIMCTSSDCWMTRELNPQTDFLNTSGMVKITINPPLEPLYTADF